jgi:hypothetical protein
MGGLGAKKFETYTAVQLGHEFADGMGPKDTNGETIRVNGATKMDSFPTLVQMQEEPAAKAAAARPAGPVRGEKQW